MYSTNLEAFSLNIPSAHSPHIDKRRVDRLRLDPPCIDPKVVDPGIGYVEPDFSWLDDSSSSGESSVEPEFEEDSQQVKEVPPLQSSREKNASTPKKASASNDASTPKKTPASRNTSFKQVSHTASTSAQEENPEASTSTGNGITMVKCKYCRSWVQRRSMPRHIRHSHPKQSNRPVSLAERTCRKCHARLSRPDALARHARKCDRR